MFRFAFLALLIALPPPGLTAQVPGTRSADEIARALQKKYDTVRDFSADFTHTYEGGILRKKAVERGRVLIKKPGMMRWTYTAPDEKVFVSDGRKLYSYVPADKQVMISPVPAVDQATTAVLFLAGKGSLTRDFMVSFVEPPAAGGSADGAASAGASATVGLKLIPKQRQTEYDWLIVGVDPHTLQLRTLVTVDQQGGTSAFAFSGLKENLGLSDKAFAFKIPRGVDVIGEPDAR